MSRRRFGRSAFSVACFAAIAGFQAHARADLQDDVERLIEDWKQFGTVVRLRPQLLELGVIEPLRLPATLQDRKRKGCVTVAVLAATSTHFVLRPSTLAGRAPWLSRDWPVPATAGAAQMVQCGAARGLFAETTIELRSPRAVVEVVVGEAPVPLPELTRSLPHRDPGPTSPAGRSGPRPIPEALAERRKQLAARARREGRAELRVTRLTSGVNGSGEALLRFAEGCHRLDLLAPVETAGAPDVDLELRLADSGRLIATDETGSSDATVESCMAEPTNVYVGFVGAPRSAEIELWHTAWDLPHGLPDVWSAELRALVAEALGRQRIRGLSRGPIFESLGTYGATLVPVELEAGACYVATLATQLGRSLGLGATVRVGSRDHHNHTSEGSESLALAFCAHAATDALIEIEARGQGLVWHMALWQEGRLPLGEVQE